MPNEPGPEREARNHDWLPKPPIPPRPRAEYLPGLGRGIVWSDLVAEMQREQAVRESGHLKAVPDPPQDTPAEPEQGDRAA